MECRAYLDIETTGLDSYYNEITTIALYDGENIKHYINGENLEEFKKELRELFGKKMIRGRTALM